MSAAATPLPPLFLERIACYQGLAQALDTEPSVAIRHNPRKSALKPAAPVPWCEWGESLASRPEFTFDPAMHQGAYYVQDASSMAEYAAVADAAAIIGWRPLRVLDMCAAPGGKTTAAIDALPEGSLVVSNEYDFKRAEILAENVAKWGYPTVAVTRGDTKRLAALESAFDIVIVDAPCSGEGMMRKDMRAREQWSPALVRQCATLQREILANAWRALKPGGILLYSTCTFNREENEDNVEWLTTEYGATNIPLPSLEAHRDAILGAATPGQKCYRFLPGKVQGEGLFMAALAKDDGEHEFRPAKAKSAFSPAPAAIAAAAKPYIDHADNYVLWQRGDTLYAVPRMHEPFLQSLASQADVLSIGVPVACVKGRDIVPTQQLALSSLLNRSAFANTEVGKDIAISYLQRQSITIDAPKGIVLLTYRGLPLGFVKNLGNRANNLYPKNWRILSSKS